MLTKNDAIAVGSAICNAAKRSSDENTGPDNKARYEARGACVYALDNIWYDVLSNKVKEQFEYDSRKWYAACGWPD